MNPLKDIVLNFDLDRERNIDFENRDMRKGQLIHIEPRTMKFDVGKEIPSEYFGVTLQFKKNLAICKLIWEAPEKANLAIELFEIKPPKVGNASEAPYDYIIHLKLKKINTSSDPQNQQDDYEFGLNDLQRGHLLDVSVINPRAPARVESLNRICKVGIV